jgi:hypothetical protein
LLPYGLNRVLNEVNVIPSSSSILPAFLKYVQNRQALFVIGGLAGDDEKRPSTLASFHLGQQQNAFSHKSFVMKIYARNGGRPVGIDQACKPV